MQAPCVFLAGTCGGSVWRDALISKLPSQFTFFNPQLPPGVKWDDAAGRREAEALAAAPVILFVLTDETEALGSLAEIGWVLVTAKRGQRVVVEIDSHPDPKVEAFRAGARDLAQLFGATVCASREAAFAATLADLAAADSAMIQSSDIGSPSSGESVEYIADSLEAVFAAPVAALVAIGANRSLELVVDWTAIREKLGENPSYTLADGAWRASKICANLAEKAGFKVERRNFPS